MFLSYHHFMGTFLFRHTYDNMYIWRCPKIGVPQNGWFIRENPAKIGDLGVPLFQETTIYIHIFREEYDTSQIRKKQSWGCTQLVPCHSSKEQAKQHMFTADLGPYILQQIFLGELLYMSKSCKCVHQPQDINSILRMAAASRPTISYKIHEQSQKPPFITIEMRYL